MLFFDEGIFLPRLPMTSRKDFAHGFHQSIISASHSPNRAVARSLSGMSAMVASGFFFRIKSNSVVAVRHNPTPALHLTNLNGGCIGVFFMTKAARQRAHELRSMPIHEISQLHVSIRCH